MSERVDCGGGVFVYVCTSIYVRAYMNVCMCMCT